MHRLITAIVLAAAVLALGGSPPAVAHQVQPLEGGAGHAPPGTLDAIHGESPAATAAVSGTEAEPPLLGVAGTLLALLAMLVLAIGHRRRVGAVILALIVMIFSFESAVHSVHHLGSAEESKCAVAAAAAHVPGTVGEPAVAPAVSLPVGGAPAFAEPAPRAAQPWRAWRGRAPPSLSVS